MLITIHYTPRFNEVERGYTGFTLSVHPSVSCCMNFAIIIQWIYFTIWEKIKKNRHHYNTILSFYNIKTLQEEFAKKSNIPWIWRIIYGHKLPYMKKTRKKKQVCGAACFMAAEIKFSKDVCLSVRLWTQSCLHTQEFLGMITCLHVVPNLGLAPNLVPVVEFTPILDLLTSPQVEDQLIVFWPYVPVCWSALCTVACNNPPGHTFINRVSEEGKKWFNSPLMAACKQRTHLLPSHVKMSIYRQVSNIRCTLTDNKIVDHSDIVRASPVGAAPTTSSL